MARLLNANIWLVAVLLVMTSELGQGQGQPKVKSHKVKGEPLKVPPEILNEILEEEAEALKAGSSLQENIDVTMSDLAREELRMNPRARSGGPGFEPGLEPEEKVGIIPESAKKREKAKEEKTKKDSAKKEAKRQKPNVVIFLADDLGYGDVGCFGNTSLRTPGIDRICGAGARLTHHVTAEATCTPSRAAMLTGRLPKRMGMASAQLLPVFAFLAQRSVLPHNETTFAEVFQANGYKTSFIGKWHLGMNCATHDDGCSTPTAHGFDYFFGLPLSNFRNLGEDGGNMIWLIRPNLRPALAAIFVVGILSVVYLRKYLGRLALVFGFGCLVYCTYNYLVVSNLHILNSVLIRQNKVVEMPVRFKHLPERFVREGEEFLEERKTDGAPFMLFMSWDQVHTHMHASPRFKGKSAHGAYGDNVEEMDWCTGQILDKLEELGMTDNTLVYFSSDNGGHHEEFNEITQEVEGGHNGIYSGGKVMGGQEGGIRVPSAISWPGHIPSDVTIDVPTSQMDLLPTLLDIIDVKPPQDRVLDGRSILPLLQGEETKTPHNIMFHYCAFWLHAARYISESGRVYKLHWYWPDWLPGTQRCEGFACQCELRHHKLTSPRLYDVTADPRELRPLDVTLPGNAAVVARMEQLRLEHEQGLESVPDQFDYWSTVYRPWLQPHCNFPYFDCEDPKNPFRS